MATRTDQPVVEEFRSTSAWVRASILLMVFAYFFYSAPLPWRLGAVVLGAAGVVTGIVTTIKVFRGTVPGIMRFTVPLATLACLVFTLATGGQALFYGPTLEYEQCRQEALTDRSQAQCQRDYEQKLRNMEGIVGS
jgi:hypothetical protein